jgi:uncharacterized protein (TIRG00374 family)
MSNAVKDWKRIVPWVRVILCIGLLTILFRQVDLLALRNVSRLAATNWPWLVAGVALTFAGLAAGAARWGAILAAQGLHFAPAKVLHITMVGQFFNAFMLGACGGDVARAFYAAREHEGSRMKVVSSILLDRGIGLFSMIVFCCLMIPFRLPIFLDSEGPRDTGFIMLCTLLTAIIGLFVLFQRNIFEHFRFFQRLEKSTRMGALIREAYDALFFFRNHHRLLAGAAALSLLNMAALTLACWSFGRALELPVPALDYFALFPIISVLMAIPITPGSLGVREGLFVSLFRSVMVDKHHAILLSLMVYMGGLLWSIIGGLVYLCHTPKAARLGRNTPLEPDTPTTSSCPSTE